MGGTDGFTLIMRDGVDPATAPNKPPLTPREHQQWVEDGLLIDRNIEVTMRDGVRILVDLYRPAGAGAWQTASILISSGSNTKAA